MTPNHDYYILDGDTPVPTDAFTCATYRADIDHIHVAYTEFGMNADGDPIRVSTVFLGFNHGWDDDAPPVLWETMIFGLAEDAPMHDLTERYTSAAEARAGHAEICSAVSQYTKHPGRTLTAADRGNRRAGGFRRSTTSTEGKR